MSVSKNTTSGYLSAATDVKYRINWLRMDNIQVKEAIHIRGGLLGYVDGATQALPDLSEEGSIAWEDIQGWSTAEKSAAKTFLKAAERTIAAKSEELKDDTHDAADVLA